MKDAKQGLIEDAIPAFLGHTHGKCRFILKRLPESWRGALVEIKEIIVDWDATDFNTLVSQGRNEIDHSNHELFICHNPDRMYFCFESSDWAQIDKV